MGKTWGIPDICLGIEDSPVFICKWNCVSSAESSLPFKKATHKQGVFSCHCPPHRAVVAAVATKRYSPSRFSFSSISERNSREQKKWWWGRVFLVTLSQINLNVDGWTQTSSLWDPDVFLGLIFVSCNPWKISPRISASKFSFLHYRAQNNWETKNPSPKHPLNPLRDLTGSIKQCLCSYVKTACAACTGAHPACLRYLPQLNRLSTSHGWNLPFRTMLVGCWINLKRYCRKMTSGLFSILSVPIVQLHSKPLLLWLLVHATRIVRLPNLGSIANPCQSLLIGEDVHKLSAFLETLITVWIHIQISILSNH